jgi:fatty acid desaturase
MSNQNKNPEKQKVSTNQEAEPNQPKVPSSQEAEPNQPKVPSSQEAEPNQPKVPSLSERGDLGVRAFAADLKNLRNEINSSLGEEDFKHLKKVERWGRLCSLAGYLTAWLIPNLISAFLISLGNVTRWAMITHHVSHRGYDKVPGVPERYKSKTFANGKRRFLDWPDWMLPAAWNYEHNILHHYYTGEAADPDLAEKSLKLVREAKMPPVIKYFIVFFYMCTWKLTYYAPNTIWVLQQERKRKKEGLQDSPRKIKSIMESEDYWFYPGMKLLLPFSLSALEFWARCVLPYGLLRFGLIPLMFLPLGYNAWLSVLLNSVIAEIITNIHSFIIIVPNHCGEDVHRFDRPISDQPEFFVRQVIGSVNYPGGTDFKDFMQGWLNYQVEHHLWPDLPMLKYREIQPQVRAICEKHGVPYIQENVFKRFRKMLDIMVGKTSMRRTDALSEESGLNPVALLQNET